MVTGIKEVPDDQISQPLKPVIRIATQDDVRREAKNREKEKDAFKICQEKIRKHGLEMKLIDAKYDDEAKELQARAWKLMESR